MVKRKISKINENNFIYVKKKNLSTIQNSLHTH